MRSSLDCSCVANPATYDYEVRCNEQVLWYSVGACYRGCHCEKHENDAFIAALERALPPLDDNGRAIT